MDTAEKTNCIKTFKDAIEPLLAAVQATPGAALDFRPPLADAWTIREHLAHFLHADIFACTRIGLCIAQPGATLFVWDEAAWNRSIDPKSISADQTIEAIRHIRAVAAALAQGAIGQDWDSLFAQHPKRGKLTLAAVLDIYRDHADFHLKYIQRNQAAFRPA
ncbi:MAG: hypothetical protein A2087_09820 [Spirochaetes bacterium GWD1_61_31]|nr:MAG: hypothetical protein A2Y37_07465 [Spirochaetes bacterium GWB1_60_80]OHD34673.1 MAG: hypothetical protein A2004_01365 [Spirochaetes bacterium GWC1_61_12]OHD34959.1 MAG: hypothetical protein A2087_09820 [Spirochaetes bacterium GWD1_61_31]OHD42429.1 MAG: hypothetical protein A2Y35_06250 [Spirochaetes bacterium GWE1_60_18]OHD59232.1 MAG: hypothetical protein A2Y32_00430 [Spirochaetes bacterium GWF1_60_12]HAW86681.1 hypothetical protein [Spirochaetaceae bacterium]